MARLFYLLRMRKTDSELHTLNLTLFCQVPAVAADLNKFLRFIGSHFPHESNGLYNNNRSLTCCHRVRGFIYMCKKLRTLIKNSLSQNY